MIHGYLAVHHVKNVLNGRIQGHAEPDQFDGVDRPVSAFHLGYPGLVFTDPGGKITLCEACLSP